MIFLFFILAQQSSICKRLPLLRIKKKWNPTSIRLLHILYSKHQFVLLILNPIDHLNIQ